MLVELMHSIRRRRQTQKENSESQLVESSALQRPLNQIVQTSLRSLQLSLHTIVTAQFISRRGEETTQRFDDRKSPAQ